MYIITRIEMYHFNKPNAYNNGNKYTETIHEGRGHMKPTFYKQ